MRTLITLIIATLATISSAQVGQPAFEEFTPVFEQGSLNPPSYNPPRNILQHQRQLQQKQIEQQNRESMRRWGYNPPPTQEEIAADLERQRKGQFQQNNKQKEIDEVLKELNQASGDDYKRGLVYNEYYKSTEFATITQPFHKAFNSLKNMEEGNAHLSVKDAYYITENAYGNVYLSYQDYTKTINSSVQFIKYWLQENHYNLKDNQALNYGIQRFMQDTLRISKPFQQTHLPFYYDYYDYAGEEDYRNIHVTKTLATGTGQCHTLPSVYCILAEGLGATAYLSYAPLHSFIKYPDRKGNIHNYEPTSYWLMSDQWYMDDLPLKAEAERNRIYLDTLNKIKIVASCITFLAAEYRERFGVADGTFLLECADFALKFFPNEADIQGQLLRVSVYGTKLHRVLTNYGIKHLEDIDKAPGARELYNQLYKVNRKLESLGYQELPKEAFKYLEDYHEQKRKLQEKNKINTKIKRKQFITSTR